MKVHKTIAINSLRKRRHSIAWLVSFLLWRLWDADQYVSIHRPDEIWKVHIHFEIVLGCLNGLALFRTEDVFDVSRNQGVPLQKGLQLQTIWGLREEEGDEIQCTLVPWNAGSDRDGTENYFRRFLSLRFRLQSIYDLVGVDAVVIKPSGKQWAQVWKWRLDVNSPPDNVSHYFRREVRVVIFWEEKRLGTSWVRQELMN